MNKASLIWITAIIMICFSSCTPVIDIKGNENSDVIYYNGEEYESETFYCADDDRRLIGRLDKKAHRARVYSINTDNSDKYILLEGSDNSGCFIKNGCSVPTSGTVTKILIDPGVRGDNSKYLSSQNELKMIEQLKEITGKTQEFAIDNYFTDGNAFYYVYDNSNVSCKNNYGGYIAYTDGNWIFTDSDSDDFRWLGNNRVIVNAVIIEDEELIKKMCETDLTKYIYDKE